MFIFIVKLTFSLYGWSKLKYSINSWIKNNASFHLMWVDAFCYKFIFIYFFWNWICTNIHHWGWSFLSNLLKMKKLKKKKKTVDNTWKIKKTVKNIILYDQTSFKSVKKIKKMRIKIINKRRHPHNDAILSGKAWEREIN